VITRFDIFMTFNAVLLIGSTAYAFFTAELEFGLYAVALIAVGAYAWKILRRFEYPIWMLLLVQVGVFAHFAGGFLPVNGSSLYWYDGLGIRFDRIVHFYNSAVVSVVVLSIYRQAGLVLKSMEAWIVIMTTMGLGAVVEVVEFTAIQVIPNTGVGDHLNTIQDMAINALGAVFGYVLFRVAASWKQSHNTGIQG